MIIKIFFILGCFFMGFVLLPTLINDNKLNESQKGLMAFIILITITISIIFLCFQFGKIKGATV